MFTIHHLQETLSTNLDARSARHGDVFFADVQTAGRGRLDHHWLSAPGENLTFSVALDVSSIPLAQTATFPLVAGLAVARFLAPHSPAVKWPNDVLVSHRKIAGILCELDLPNIICGIGLNVNQTSLPPAIASTATSLALITGSQHSTSACLDAILAEISSLYTLWLHKGFAAIHPLLSPLDTLKGRTISILRTDSDPAPLSGLCGGIQPDGTLLVAGTPVFAGEAHIL